MQDKIILWFDRPKGKKNNNSLARTKTGVRFIPNAKAKKAEKDMAEKILEAALEAGWEVPLKTYIELDIEYDYLIDQIKVTITNTQVTPPKQRWGGRYDIQNMIDVVADAMEDNKRHDGIIFNDNRISRVSANRDPRP